MNKKQIEKSKEYLKKIRNIGETLSFLEDRIKFYEILCEKCTNTISDMPRGNARTTEELYVKLLDLKSKYNSEFEEKGMNYAEAELLIESLEDERYKKILHYYYLERLSLEKVALKVGYHLDHVKKLKREAIEAFSKNI